MREREREEKGETEEERITNELLRHSLTCQSHMLHDVVVVFISFGKLIYMLSLK
jgi:hypothetical protein